MTYINKNNNRVFRGYIIRYVILTCSCYSIQNDRHWKCEVYYNFINLTLWSFFLSLLYFHHNCLICIWKFINTFSFLFTRIRQMFLECHFLTKKVWNYENMEDFAKANLFWLHYVAFSPQFYKIFSEKYNRIQRIFFKVKIWKFVMYMYSLKGWLLILRNWNDFPMPCPNVKFLYIQ